MKKNTQMMVVAAVGFVGVFLLLLLIAKLVSKPRPLPKELVAELQQTGPPPPADLRCTPVHYAAVNKAAAERYQIKEVSPEVVRQPLKGGTEFHGLRLLLPGKRGGMETPHLRLQASITKLATLLDGNQTLRADHLILSITNKSDVPLAYRVMTNVRAPEKCGLKAEFAHNAIALRPRETIRRTECLYHNKQGVAVIQVDVYELTELGYRYVSRLDPTPGSPFDFRVAHSHDRGGLPPCRVLPWRDLDSTLETWVAVIDFHARHDCDEYSMPGDYKPWKQPGTLPVCRK